MRDMRGFTLPELITAIVIIVAALVAAGLLLHPVNYKAQNDDAERRLGVARIAQALVRYRADKGALPDTLPSSPTLIASLDEGYDLCQELVPTYLPDMPLDPVLGVKIDVETEQDTSLPCSDDNVEYMSGYTVFRDQRGKVHVEAPHASSGNISIVL